ncbi:ABC transporter ATP-binding protein/permease [Tessaracoccus caeni]|uniref:ABC transporter ATP-binding protein/permease n=1 Tax=Tessaracoccus caeni TaxID=3031239 RepID=UPI0023DB2F8D|nr:ABC transporter ATP-binding protein/permease [Tessaracoccus caeni]MDF1489680.1 ATP-binding cassette domain-containing protein [Tessaracoccus caeni]
MAKRGFQGAIMRGFGARDHIATVHETELIAPHFLRVRMNSATLFSELEVAPTAWMRFWFPDPDGGETEHQRGYTLAEADPTTGDFAVDFVLHEPAGPASTWAQRAQRGTTVPVMALATTKFELPDDLPSGYLLIGDSASIPGITGILQTIPPEVPIELYLEQHDERDRLIPLPDHPKLSLHWVPRQDASSLAAAIEARDWSDWKAWVACESASLKALRARLKEEFGFPKSEVYAQAYWIHGRAMGKNRSRDEAESAPNQPVAPQAAAEVSDEAPTPAATSPQPSVGEPTAARGTWRVQAGNRLLAPLKQTFIIAGVSQGLVTLLQLVPYVLIAELARRMLDGAAAAELWGLGLWAMVVMGLGALLATGLLVWLHVVDARFEREVRERLLTKLSRLPLGWFDARTSGQVKQVIQDDTLSLHYLATHAVPDAVAAIVAPITVLVYLFVVDWRLGLVLLLPVLVYIVTMWAMVVASGAKTAQAQRWAERMNSEAGSYLDGQSVVRVFGGGAASSFRARVQEYIDFLGAWQRPFIRQKTIMDLATRPTTFLLLIAVFGTLRITVGAMDPASLLPFLLLGTTFGARLLGIGYGLSGLRGGLTAARRIQLTLDEPELDTAPDLPRLPAPAGRVEFDGVGFSYRPGVPVLSDISLTLEPGTVTALVGPSGSGKSTLAALLARFHDVGEGAIRIGGDDVRALSADELYRRVGFVFQDSQLVQGTVCDNIALARPDAALDEVERAARAAQIHDRIAAMPQGYDTPLGPDVALSGGERQRLTIARAILADTPVLVLDEATAFADPESEYQVQQALNRLTAGRTVLVIAHRLHTIVDVDRIVVLDHGRIAEAGTHTDLLAADGRYRQLWEARGTLTVPEGARS